MSKIICITGSSGGIAKEIQTKLLQNDNIKVYGCSRKNLVLNIKITITKHSMLQIKNL